MEKIKAFCLNQTQKEETWFDDSGNYKWEIERTRGSEGQGVLSIQVLKVSENNYLVQWGRFFIEKDGGVKKLPPGLEI